MRGKGISRGMAVAAMVVAFSQTALAQGSPPCKDACWIDAKTGERVPTIPGGALYEDGGRLHSGLQIGGGNEAHNPKTGQNFTRIDGTWIDAKSGLCVPTIPGGALYEDGGRLHSGLQIGGGNEAHNPKTGQNFVRIPCPPPSTASSTIGGGYIGGELVQELGPRSIHRNPRRNWRDHQPVHRHWRSPRWRLSDRLQVRAMGQQRHRQPVRFVRLPQFSREPHLPRRKLPRHHRELHGHGRRQDRSAARRGRLALRHCRRERDE